MTANDVLISCREPVSLTDRKASREVMWNAKDSPMTLGQPRDRINQSTTPDSAGVWRMSRMTRDATAEISQDHILKRERGQGKKYVSLLS